MVNQEDNRPKNLAPLSPREKEVLVAWSKTPDPKVLAAALRISEHTVLTYLRRARRKFGVRRTWEVWVVFRDELA